MKFSTQKISTSLIKILFVCILLLGFSNTAGALDCLASGTHTWGKCSVLLESIPSYSGGLNVGQAITLTNTASGYSGSETWSCIAGPAWSGPTNSSCVAVCPADSPYSETRSGAIAQYCADSGVVCGTDYHYVSSISCHAAPGWAAYGNSCTAPSCGGCGCVADPISASINAATPVLYGTASNLVLQSSGATSCNLSGIDPNISTNVRVDRSTAILYSNQTYAFGCSNANNNTSSGWQYKEVVVCAQGQTISGGNCISAPAPTTTGLEIHHTPNPGTIYPTTNFVISWSGGSNSPTYYNASLYNTSLGSLYYPNLLIGDGTTSGNRTATTFPGAPSGGLSGSYLLKIQACNSSGCSDWVNGTTLTITPPIVAPTTASITVTPTTVSSNQIFSASWSGNNTPTSYNAKIHNTSTGADLTYTGLTTTSSGDLTAATIPLAVGSYIFQIQPCNSAGCTPGWFDSNTLSVVLSTVVIGTFNANSTPDNLNLPYGGGSVTLSWTTTNATSCTITGGGRNDTFTGASALNGSETFNVTTSATYNITCQ